MQENKWVINILLVIIMILVVVGCIVGYMCLINDVEIIEVPEETPIFSEESYPRIDGSTVTLPLAETFKAAFTETDINEVEVEHSETHNAYVNLIKGDTDLILVPYPTEEEQKLAKSSGIELEIVPIVKDAFVFFVNKENFVENLTINQIKDIYSGKTTNWKDIGGVDNKIEAYQRPENSDSQTAMLKFVMQGTKIIEPIKENVSQGGIDIIDVIADYDNTENAIGYSYSYYYSTIYTTNEMKLLSIDGIKPTYDNIRTGLYDLQTTYYAVIRKNEPETGSTRKLLNAMKSEIGQNVAKEAGYVQNY